MSALHLEIVTPDKQLLSADVDYVSAPGFEGEFGVLPGHIPYVSALKTGALAFVQGSMRENVFVSGGFAEVQDNTVTVLAESAERAQDIDSARAQASLERARKRLDQRTESLDVARAEAALKRALVRLSLSSMK